MSRSHTSFRLRAVANLSLVATVLFVGAPASAQLRIVTYNTNTFGTQGDIPGLPSNHRPVRVEADIVFEAIAEETVNGIQRAPDIVLLQEQQQPDTTTANLVTRLNAIFADQGITYARGFEVGDTTSGNGLGTPNSSEIRQSVVYRTDTVQLIAEDSFGDLIGGQLATQPRETLLHQFRPVGYGPEADLYLFNSHFEAGDSSDIISGFAENLAGREIEADQIRSYIDANGLGDANVIVGGDLNVDSNFETSGITIFGGLSAIEILTAPGNGRVLDPLNPTSAPFTYTFNSSISRYLTQSPCEFSCGDLTGGGIDDRFDFLLQSDELLDGEGVAAIPGTLRSFGNNGSTFNDAINVGNSATINGLTSFTNSQVLNALASASDHLPVIEEFQLPAVLDAVLAAVPATVMLGETVDLDLTISNAANVQVAIGADELDFTFTTSGAVTGSGSGIDAALGAGVVESVTLDTSTVGLQTGLITVSTSSQAAANALVTIPVSFEVLAAGLAGDFDGDGEVTAADYALWRSGASPDPLSTADFDAWRSNFGQQQATATSVTVPEPSAVLLGLIGALLPLRRRR